MDRQTNKRAIREQAQQGLNEVNNVVETPPQKQEVKPVNPLTTRAQTSQAKRKADLEKGMLAGRIQEVRTTFAGKQLPPITGHSSRIRGGEKQIVASNRLADVAKEVALQNIRGNAEAANEPVQRIKQGDTTPNPRLNVSNSPKTVVTKKDGKVVSRPLAAPKKRRSRGK